MKKRYLVFILIFILMLFIFDRAFAADQSDSNSASVQQARQDYREFAKQLKAVTEQYKQITAEVSKVLKEEGFPTYDEDSGEIGWSQDVGATDIRETDDAMIVNVDLPGVKKDKIKVSIQNSKTLHIRGERKVELQRGAFEKIIELPSLAKDTGIEARYEDGVLTVKIPKLPGQKKEVAVPVR